MMPEDLKRLAIFWLKRCRVSQRGRQFQRVLKSPKALGAVAHHAARLLFHADQINFWIKGAVVEKAISEAVSAGRHLAMIEEAQREKPRTITGEDFDFMVKAKRRSDKETYALDKHNAEAAVQIDPSDFDGLRKQGKTFEAIAERYDCSVQALRNWRIKNKRLN